MNQNHFRPHQPYLPPRTIDKIAVARITHEIEIPSFGPVAVSTWCIGPTIAQAVARFTKSHPAYKILGYEALAGANLKCS